jgi:hypothetical protein
MTGSGFRHALRLWFLGVIPRSLAPLALMLAIVAPGAARADDKRAPDLGECQELQVPQGNKLSYHAFGVGVQIYEWTGSSWTFVAPEAVLYASAKDNSFVGVHFRGPTWRSISGSEVIGVAIEHCTPDPDSIPWLLLAAAFTEGPGIFQDVTYIQRLNTVGGIAPAVPGDFLGQVASVPYSADYFFYRAGH